MIALCIADLHAATTKELKMLSDVPLTSYDVVILLGDIYEHVLDYIEEYILPHKKVLGIEGNHDSLETLISYGFEDIHGKNITEKEITFAGIHGSFKYKPSRFPSLTQEESLLLSEDMSYADVLISHTSPFGIHEKDTDVHAGLIGITSFIQKHRPVYHLHGHQHLNIQTVMPNGTTVIGMHGVVLFNLLTGQTKLLFD